MKDKISSLIRHAEMPLPAKRVISGGVSANATITNNKRPSHKRFKLHDNQQQEVWQQREGKALALAEERDPLNGVAIGEDGKPVEREIILSEHYDENNPGLAGGAEEAEELSADTKSICTYLGAMLDTTDTVLNAADKLTMDPASKLVIGILKAAMQKRQNDELNNKVAAISGKLDTLILGHYHEASRHLNNAKRATTDKTKKGELKEATKEFTSSIAHTQRNTIIHIESKYYAGVCFSLRNDPGLALDHFNEVYNEGHELWNQYIEELNKLEKSWSLDKDKKIKEIADNLICLYQYMKPVKRIVEYENAPSSYDNVASTSSGDLRSLQPASRDIIDRFYHYGDEYKRKRRYDKAIHEYSRAIALAGGNHSESLIGRSDAKRLLGDSEGALHDFNDIEELIESDNLKGFINSYSGFGFMNSRSGLEFMTSEHGLEVLTSPNSL